MTRCHTAGFRAGCVLGLYMYIRLHRICVPADKSYYYLNIMDPHAVAAADDGVQ